MSWIDFIIGGVVLLMAFLFAFTGEGAGVAVYRALALVVAAWSAHKFYTPISDAISLNATLAYLLLFMIVGLLLLIASAALYNALPLDISPFNGMVKFVFGIVAGWAVCYAMLDVMTLTVAHDSSVGQAVTSSVLAPEVLTFRTITSSKTRLDSTTFGPRDPWEKPPAYQDK
jgi:hypothetical protein